MAWEVRIKPKAQKQIEKLHPLVAKRILGHIGKLADNPYPSGTKKIQGRENLFRVRVGDWRIVYEVMAKRLLVLVVNLGHRKDVYRR